MTELDKLKIEHARLVGEFIGIIDALHWWMLPEELMINLENKKKELIEKYDAN